MPTVGWTIKKHWRQLPAEVRNYRAFTDPANGAPSWRVRRTILRPLLAATAEGYRYSVTQWSYDHEISNAAAEAIGAQLAHAGPLLAAAAKWHVVLLDEYPGWVAERGSEPADDAREWLMLRSLSLATRLGSPGEASAQAARTAMDERAGPAHGPSAKDVQRYLHQHAAELNDLLDATWAGVGTSSAGGSDEAGGADSTELMSVLEDFHQAAHLAHAERWDGSSPARATAVRAWERLCAITEEGAGTTLVALSSTSPPRRPALKGTKRGTESLPLDRSIADRLTRMFKSPAVKVRHLDEQPATPPTFGLTTARELAERTIVDGVAPFGLHDAAARALLLAAFRAVRNVGWVPDRRAREAVAAAYPSPSDQYFIGNWARVGWHHAPTAGPGTTLGRLIESPGSLFVSRMWARAARTQFQEPEWRPDARMAWDHVRGNYWSIFDDMMSGARYRQQVGPVLEYDDEHSAVDSATGDGWWPVQGALDTVIEAVLDTGRELDGIESVVEFRLATQDGEGWPQATWDAWVAASGHADDEYPSFDQVQQHLMRQADVTDDLVEGRPPSLADVEAVVSFVRRGGGGSADTVRRFFARLAVGEEPWPERDVTLWDQWGERFARHQRDLGSQDDVIPTFRQMVALLSAAGVLDRLAEGTDAEARDGDDPAGSE